MRNTKRASSLLNEVGQQPKSDYTYSASLTYRQRVTPDRKIGSPNMSRRTLKGGTISFVGTPEFSESDEVSSNTWDLRSRTVLKPMDALSDGSDAEENAEQQLPSTRSRRSTRSRSHDLPRSNGSLTRTITTVSTEYTTSRTLHHGLDADSDVDDGTESGVPVRATPILARGGTPLGRAITPLPTLKLSSSRRSSTSSVDVGKGFILREGTIAEDVEVDEETPKDLITRWSHTITTITTVITASIAMVATSAVNAISGSSSSKGKLEGNEKSTISRYSSVMKSKWSAFCDHLRKKPILIWIPLLFILLLLSLLTYWWLLQSRGKTAGDSDPTENDGPSFFSALLLLVSDFSYQIYSGLCSVLNVIWLMTTNSFSWLINAVYDSALYCYESISAMCIWLGASTISVLSWCWSWIAFICALLLQWLNLAGEYVKFCALGIYNTLLSLATYMYGLLTFSTPVVSGIHEGTREDSIGIVAWITKISPMERISDMYLAVAEGAHSSGNILWNIWLWLVISMGEIFSAAASYLLWGLSSILAACLFLLTGLWTFLTFIWGNLVSFLWAVAAPFSLMLKSSSSVSTIPIAKPVIQPVLTDVSHPKIEEIVQQVLGSEKLIDHITASIAKAHEGQLTYDGVTAAARLVIEQELTVVKEEMASVKKEISTDAATSEAQQYMIVQLQKEKTNLIKELQMLGQRLFSVEGKINAADARSLQENLEIVKQINKLEMDHKDLAADVKSCCDEEKLPLLIGKIFGISSDELMDNGKPDIAAWLENYFVAKKELAVKLDELMATMKVKDSDQVIVSQTRDIVMSTVLAQLQENMKAHQQQFSAEAKLQISAQVESQVKGAVGSLEKEVIDQVVKQVNLKNLQLKDNVKEKVSEAVQEHYKSVVDAAIRKAVDEAVNTAVPNAVGKSLPEILMNILPSLVLEEVTASVPEVVASVVPAAVSAAISEATNHESQHEAKEETMEGTKEKMGNEIVGITGSGSANMTIESNGGSAFISGMDLAGGLNKTEVLKIVDDALKKYDADKTGMVDHALESAGGNIVSTRCTESYQVHQAEVRVLGFPIYWYSTNNPRTIIQPETLPGQCWAFKGSQGFVVIQLAGEVQPTGFTLEHIPKSLTPNGAIDSAPREFEVFGLTQENDLGEKLGDYVYTDNGNALQYFPVQENNSDYYPFIELKIKSNHGNIHYTCLYRFRVHGLRRLL